MYMSAYSRRMSVHSAHTNARIKYTQQIRRLVEKCS